MKIKHPAQIVERKKGLRAGYCDRETVVVHFVEREYKISLDEGKRKFFQEFRIDIEVIYLIPARQGGRCLQVMIVICHSTPVKMCLKFQLILKLVLFSLFLLFF